MCCETICWASSPSLINQCVVEGVYKIHRIIITLIPSVVRRPPLRAPKCVSPVPVKNYIISLQQTTERKNSLLWQMYVHAFSILGSDARYSRQRSAEPSSGRWAPRDSQSLLIQAGQVFS